jgi:hypothetical protein
MNHKPSPQLRDDPLSGDRDGCGIEPCPQHRAVHQHDENRSEQWNEVRYSCSFTYDSSTMLFKESFGINFKVQDAPVDANMRDTSLPAEFAQESDGEANSGSKLRFCECEGSSFGTKHNRFLNFLSCKQNLLWSTIWKV